MLERAAQAFADGDRQPAATCTSSRPTQARAVLDDVQAAPIDKLPVDEHWITVPADVGDVRVRMLRPPNATGTLPVILYMHGGGWVLGNAGTHDRLVRELVDGTGAALAFVEYDRSPEARFPVAIEQGYAVGAAHHARRRRARPRPDPDGRRRRLGRRLHDRRADADGRGAR